MYEAGAREAPPRPPAVRAYAPAVQPRHALLAVAVAAAWGANFVAIAIGLEGMSPLVLASARFALSALPVLVLYRDGPGVPWRPLLVASAASGIAQFALLFSGIEAGMPAGLSSLVLQVQALFTILIAAGVLGERPTRLQLAGVLVSMAGLLGIAVERGASAGFAPFLLVIGAAVGWAVGNVATRVARPTDPFRFVAWWSVGPPLPLLGLAAVVDGPGVLAAAAQRHLGRRRRPPLHRRRLDVLRLHGVEPPARALPGERGRAVHPARADLRRALGVGGARRAADAGRGGGGGRRPRRPRARLAAAARARRVPVA